MLRRVHLHLSNRDTYIQPGNDYTMFIHTNFIIDLLSNIIIIILLAMLTIIMISSILTNDINVNKTQSIKSKKYK